MFSEELDEQNQFQTLDYFDAAKASPVEFPNLKPKFKSISLRLPEGMIGTLKSMANGYDVPYQSLIKMLLAKDIENERRKIKV